jgi:hypothetical protein
VAAAARWSNTPSKVQGLLVGVGTQRDSLEKPKDYATYYSNQLPGLTNGAQQVGSLGHYTR